MTRRKAFKGFSLIEAVVITGVLVLLAGLGIVGWRAFTSQSRTAATIDASPASRQSAEVITTKADLEAAEKALDEINFDDESANQAELQANL